MALGNEIGVTVSTTVLGLTKPDGGARTALIQAETANIRWRYDGTDPTTTAGMLLSEGEEILISGEDAINAFEMVRDGSTDATVNVAYT